MRTEDVPQHIRDRVAQANQTRVSIGNTASWHTLAALKALASSMFGTSSKPRRATAPPHTATAKPAATAKPKPRVLTQAERDAALYRKAWPNG